MSDPASPRPGRLAGKSIIVTGAGSRGPGIGNGKAASILFAREGGRLLLVDALLERAEETAEQIRGEGGDAIAFAADVSSRDGCAAMVARALEAYGRIDVLHNNVGVESRLKLADVTDDEWDRVLRIDLKSMLLAAQAAAPHLIAGGGGAIINVSSIAGLRGTPLTAYAAAKAGAIGLTLSLAAQLGPQRVRVNAIAPGYVYTPMVAGGMSEETRARRRRAALLPDEGTGWDIGWAAVYLASEEARWVTGHVLVVDGGLTAAAREDPLL